MSSGSLENKDADELGIVLPLYEQVSRDQHLRWLSEAHEIETLVHWSGQRAAHLARLYSVGAKAAPLTVFKYYTFCTITRSAREEY